MLQPDRARRAGILSVAERRPARQAGWTLMELVVAMTLLVLIGSFGVVRYTKTLETSSADLAAGYLESVWTAQRFYWLEHGEYADGLDDLRDEGFLDTADPPAEDV